MQTLSNKLSKVWRRLLGKSGSIQNRDIERDECLSEVFQVLNRDVELDAIGALAQALRPVATSVSLRETVIAFDANVFLRLSSHSKSEDIIDFLGTSFDGNLVLPGQVVQEFWNNQFLAVDSLADSIRKKAESLRTEVKKIDSSFEDFSVRFETLLDEFHNKYGYIYDANTLRRTGRFIDILAEKAIVSYAPRKLLSELSRSRKRAKTPPGFKDDLDGDFYVWVDLLFGLSLLRKRHAGFLRVALISHEKKLDWSRGGIPHPILSAEVKALSGASFEIWSIDKLLSELSID